MASSRDPSTFLKGVVHEGTQREGRGFDLTLAAVHEVETPGRVDFGGGELVDAGTTPVEPEKLAPEDDYGWYDLGPGQYLLEYNETLTAEDVTFVVQPRTALVTKGVFHPTMHVERLHPMPLAVGDSGVRLKENARVSTLLSEPLK